MGNLLEQNSDELGMTVVELLVLKLNKIQRVLQYTAKVSSKELSLCGPIENALGDQRPQLRNLTPNICTVIETPSAVAS